MCKATFWQICGFLLAVADSIGGEAGAGLESIVRDLQNWGCGYFDVDGSEVLWP